MLKQKRKKNYAYNVRNQRNNHLLYVNVNIIFA